MTLKSCAVGMRNAIPRNHLKFRPDWSSLRPIYTMRLRRVRQDYDRLTTWLKTIYTHTTFSLAKLNTPKFVPEFTESILVVLCFEKASQRDVFALILSVLFEKRLHVNQWTTTSSAILTQENFSFVPYSVEICQNTSFLSISATIAAAF